VGCPLVKFCPAKTIIGDFHKYAPDTPPESVVEGVPPEETKTDSPGN